MTRHLRLREFLVGLEGVALMRGLFTGDDADAQRRIDETRRLVGDEEAALFGAGVDVPELDVADGYARWSTTYDAPGNPLISVEEPLVWQVLDAAAPGCALDAACGTGRHSARLLEAGHQVIGIDATEEMLALARENVPGARFEAGDLRMLPLEDGAVDLAVCALALDHVPDLEAAVSELARVVRGGGSIVISDMHPVLSALGGAAFFRDSSGGTALVRGYGHSHADYLAAFAAVGLEVRQCIEGSFGASEVGMQQPASTLIPEATAAAFLGLPAVLIWDLARLG